MLSWGFGLDNTKEENINLLAKNMVNLLEDVTSKMHEEIKNKAASMAALQKLIFCIALPVKLSCRQQIKYYALLSLLRSFPAISIPVTMENPIMAKMIAEAI